MTKGHYSVSDTGIVRRDLAVRGNCNAGKPIKPRMSAGYFFVNISVFGVAQKIAVHRLVADAFIGPAPFPRAQVNHKDGVKTNNHPDNLEWCSSGDNLRHALANKLRVNKPGELASHHKLTAGDVLFIWRNQHGASPTPQKQLARKYQVSQTLVSRIKLSKCWKHLKGILAPEIND